MIRRSERSFLLALVVLATASVFAQSDYWYQNQDHNFKNRWEGLVGEDQGSPEWELRSFVANVEPYPPDKDVDLNLLYYVPDSTKAFIRATSINRNPSYLMVPKDNVLKNEAAWRSFKGWPTKTVILPRKISSTNLGVLIRLGADSEAVHLLAPAIVYYSNKPKPLKTYHLDFFTAVPLRNSSFNIIGQKNYRHDYPLPGANARSILQLEFNAADIPDGLTKVILTLAYEDSQKRDITWQFYSKGLP